MNFHIYLLLSEKDKKTYLGSTDNLERRIKEHNDGKNLSTKHRRPLNVIYTEEAKTLYEARKREKFLKSRKGRKELKDIFNNLKINSGE